MAFLRAFTDDSASDVGDRRLFMAGYMNRTELWARFAEAWAEELRGAPSIEYLKMAEAQNLRDQFDWRKGWTEEKRDEKLRGLARVIRHFNPISFQMSIDRRVALVRPKSQWRKFKRETAALISAGIDPSKITKPGIYYPKGTPLLVRLIDRFRRFLRRD